MSRMIALHMILTILTFVTGEVWRDGTGSDSDALTRHADAVYIQARKDQVPLALWIGFEDAAVQRALPHVRHVHVANYHGLTGPRVVVCAPEGGKLWKRTGQGIPASEATVERLRYEASGDWWRVQATVTRPVFNSPRGQSC